MSMRNNVARLDGAFLQEMPAPDEPPLEDIASRLIVGDAETCAEKLAAEIDGAAAGACQLLHGTAGHAAGSRTLRSMEMFGKDVMPRIRSCRRRARAHWPRSLASTRARYRPWTQGRGYALLAAVPCLYLAVFFVWPLARVALRSVMEPHPGIGNYTKILFGGPFLQILIYTLEVAAIVTAVSPADRLSGCRADGAHAGAQVAIDDGVDRRVAVDQRGDPQLRVDDPVPALWHRESGADLAWVR